MSGDERWTDVTFRLGLDRPADGAGDRRRCDACQLSPSEMFPAFAPHIAVRTVALRSGVRVRVAESGPSDGRPVVMLHGWGASLYMFRHALDRFPRAGIRAIAVDLRGYGLSDKPPAR